MHEIYNKSRMPTEQQALPGREQALDVPNRHFVTGGPSTLR